MNDTKQLTTEQIIVNNLFLCLANNYKTYSKMLKDAETLKNKNLITNEAFNSLKEITKKSKQARTTKETTLNLIKYAFLDEYINKDALKWLLKYAYENRLITRDEAIKSFRVVERTNKPS